LFGEEFETDVTIEALPFLKIGAPMTIVDRAK